MGFQETFKALSDPTRRRILDILKTGGRTAGEISSQFDMTAATISHHLAVLREAGLVDQDKRGKYIYYELNMSVLDELVGWVASLKGGDGDEEGHT
ncbi:MAG TPA: autorepressor SdpR family transcription factor [Pseudoflavonifractor sp.]|nr:autorepressor SdpR family transcription factor [Pseudoflavonifractor sp.]